MRDFRSFPDGGNRLFVLRNVRTLSEAHPLSFKWARGALSLGAKRRGREIGDPVPSSVDIKNKCNLSCTLLYGFVVCTEA